MTEFKVGDKVFSTSQGTVYPLPSLQETPEALLELIQKTLEDNQSVLDRMDDLLN